MGLRAVGAISLSSNTSALQLPNGTVSTPSIYFASDTSTGWYRSASNQWTFETGGTTAWLSLISGQQRLAADFVVGWNSSTGDSTGSVVDTTLSRNAGGIVQVGTSAANASGKVNAARFSSTTAGSLSATTGAATLDVTAANLFTLTPTGDMTITTTGTMPVGTVYYLVITTSGVTSRTLTFSTGFKVTGTLATGTTGGKVFVMTFIGDGTNVNELARTTAM